MIRKIYFAIRRRLLRLFGMDDARRMLTLRYRQVRRRKPDLEHPSDLSEWLIARIVNRENDCYADLTDKVKVRDYVAGKGLSHLLPELYGVGERAEELDFDALPERFALKANHGCEFNIICQDKSALDVPEATRKLNGWLATTYNPIESHYSLIEPRVYAEEFITGEGEGKFPNDYKFICIHGEPVCVFACSEREKGVKFYLFDMDWNYRPEHLTRPWGDGDRFRKPQHFEQMKQYARTLARDFDFVRVDLYDTGDRVWFGELTFSPAVGIMDYFTDGLLRELYAKIKR